jgi:hypothetical protein
MKRNRWSALSIFTLALGAVAQSRPVLACAACFGQSDSALAKGMNWGIFALLFVVVGVLAGISTFFIFMARRAANLPEASSQPEFTEFSTQV